jgi:hypothetical protein
MDNQYAPNPSWERNEPASLTASLLARKGEAAPAVDAAAHEGVDIAAYAVQAQRRRSSTPDGGCVRMVNGVRDVVEGGNVRVFRPRPANANRRRAATQRAPGRNLPVLALRALPAQNPDPDGERKPKVSFRMPAQDFVRLYLGSKDLEVTCRSIILDALEAYLDANDIPRLSRDECERELERLSSIRRRRCAASA